jgi:hypothetical protein
MTSMDARVGDSTGSRVDAFAVIGQSRQRECGFAAEETAFSPGAPSAPEEIRVHSAASFSLGPGALSGRTVLPLPRVGSFAIRPGVWSR